MNFVIYTHWNQLPDSASILFAQAERDSLFLSRTWFENLSAHALANQQVIRLACVVDNERVLAVLPMLNSPRDGLCALSNNFTTLFSALIIRNNSHTAILACLAAGLSQMDVNSIHLEPIDADDVNVASLCQCMELCGFKSHTYFRFYNWSHAVDSQGFDEYMAKRPGNIRNLITRKKRKLEREHAYDIRLYMDADIERALADYQVIYQSSWKANEFYPEFTPNIVKRFSRLGWLRMAILYIEKNPVAAQIWFVVHGKANIYRLAYDPRWKSYSPGSILTEYLMRYVIDTDKVSEIDYLTGNERYKQDWMTVRKERLGMRFVKQPVQKNIFSRMYQRLRH
tara:strand:- start:1485 stop:2504 length:1020 start_codon:yes stop_codon:yes gene_type:complete